MNKCYHLEEVPQTLYGRDLHKAGRNRKQADADRAIRAMVIAMSSALSIYKRMEDPDGRRSNCVSFC